MKPVVPLPKQFSWLQSLLSKSKIPIRLGTDMVLILSNSPHQIAGSGRYLVKTKRGTFNSNLARTSSKTVVMATAPQVSFYFFRDVQNWHQVSRTMLQYFQRFTFIFSCTVYYDITFLISIIKKRLISLERKRIFHKGKCHSPVF